MTDSGYKVLAGFVRLSDADRRGVIEAINRFVAATADERAAMRSEYEKTVMGPVGSACPCCQR
jgi:hypothetical protein